MTNLSDPKIVQRYSRARLARDARFDGVFYTAVKTTKIYCRPICPAVAPKEDNVEYHSSAFSAAQAGYRPCLRCRPDSSPGSCAWQGTDTTLQRAVKLISEGALQEHSLEHLSGRLGVSSRHLRALFKQKLGTSPKRYALYQQCLMAKQLLHDSHLSINEIAFAAGFNSVRRFNEAMQERLALNPSQIRRQASTPKTDFGGIELTLYYRPPFQWRKLLSFLQSRIIEGLEWCDGDSYGRNIVTEKGSKGFFEIRPISPSNHVTLKLWLNDLSDVFGVVQRIKALFDLDASIHQIDEHLQSLLGDDFEYAPGLRIPGVWSGFEAGVRAVLGQQVSVKQAHTLVTILVEHLGETCAFDGSPGGKLFPTPDALLNSDLSFFKMPQSRKDTLHRLAEYSRSHPQADDFDAWLDIKGIGPWTVNYVKLRAGKDPDVWLAGDAGVKNALDKLAQNIDVEAAAPWRSYLVFQLWNQL